MKNLVRQKLADKFPGLVFDVLIPPDPAMGDYSTNAAFVLAKKDKKNPQEIGEKLIRQFRGDEEINGIFREIKFAKPGFINFYLSDDFLRRQLDEISNNKNYGANESIKGQTVMVEYTDPNPFKLFHIGHLMSNAIGETIARLHEASGAKVLRANYQGDIGLHVAKTILGWQILEDHSIKPGQTLKERIEYFGFCYTLGSAGAESPLVLQKINGKGLDHSIIEERNKRVERGDLDLINKAIYERSGGTINEMYDKGRKWSLEYFETIYKKLGTRFDRYFFESETASDGLSIVEKYPDIFVESDGARVFRGEEYGLHTRVFVSSKGLPTYEAKELGVNKKKFENDNLDLSIIITGNEINEYFKVLLKAMELIMPEVAAKTKHISHGMLRLPEGKMSSRTGDVITADSLIEQIKEKLPESESEEAKEKIAIGAIKYSILKQSPGHDIIFDFDKSLSVKGDSAPYLQYTYARLNSILDKANAENYELGIRNYDLLKHELELNLIKKLLLFPDAVSESRLELAPQHLALYVYELANTANRFYEAVRILDGKDAEWINARLGLVGTVADVIKTGLYILGIETPNRV